MSSERAICSSINYGEFPAQCRYDDEACTKKMAAGSLMLAVDQLTSDETDGIITVDQLRTLLDARGELTDAKLIEAGRNFNRQSQGAQLSAVPLARDFKSYLKNNHPCFYQSLFPTSDRLPKGSVDVKQFIRNNLTGLAQLLDKVANGESQMIDQKNYVVRIYLNGFGLPDAFDQDLIDDMGGQAHAKKAYDLLAKAIGHLPPPSIAESSTPCDQPMPDGSVDLSGCYRSVAARLRQLAALIK